MWPHGICRRLRWKHLCQKAIYFTCTISPGTQHTKQLKWFTMFHPDSLALARRWVWQWAKGGVGIAQGKVRYKNSLLLWHETGRKILCILTGGLICMRLSWVCQATFEVGRWYPSTYFMEKWTKITYAVFSAGTCHGPGKLLGVMCLKELQEHEVEMSQTLPYNLRKKKVSKLEMGSGASET